MFIDPILFLICRINILSIFRNVIAKIQSAFQINNIRVKYSFCIFRVPYWSIPHSQDVNHMHIPYGNVRLLLLAWLYSSIVERERDRYSFFDLYLLCDVLFCSFELVESPYTRTHKTNTKHSNISTFVWICVPSVLTIPTSCFGFDSHQNRKACTSHHGNSSCVPMALPISITIVASLYAYNTSMPHICMGKIVRIANNFKCIWRSDGI